MLDDYGYGYEKKSYAYEEHEEHYESDHEYDDHHHSGLKFMSSPKHNMFEEGWRHGEDEHHHHEGGGRYGREVYRPVGGRQGKEVHHQRERKSSDAYYDNGPADKYEPAWHGYKLVAPETPARKVYLNPGRAQGVRVQEVKWKNPHDDGSSDGRNRWAGQGGHQKGKWVAKGL